MVDIKIVPIRSGAKPPVEKPKAEGDPVKRAELTEQMPGYWRGRAAVRIDAARALNFEGRAADEHQRIAHGYEVRAIALEKGKANG